MTEQHGTSPRRFHARRLVGGGVVVVATGAVIFSSTALLGVGAPSATPEAFVPPGMQCDSPISCTEPVGTVAPAPSRVEVFVQDRTHDVKTLAAQTLAPRSATAEHVPTASANGGCGCPVCCAAQGGEEAVTEARKQQEARLVVDVIRADASANASGNASAGRSADDGSPRREP